MGKTDTREVWERGLSGDGRRWERNCVGEVTNARESRGGYLCYDIAMEDARTHQPYDPRYPAGILSVVVQTLVKCYQKEVRGYTAVGSALDYWHGVDCWIECAGMVVTIDLTINPNKKSTKADILYHGKNGSVYVLTKKVVEEILWRKQRHST